MGILRPWWHKYSQRCPLHSTISEFSRLRVSAGLSVDAFVEKAGFSRSTVYRWERGDGEPHKAAVQLLEGMVRLRKEQETEKPKLFKFIDLFAGIGGLRRGFEEWGECVFTSEWDKYSQITYLANFNCNHKVEGDITKVPVESIPAHDLLLAGFPCQPFSIAGVSKKNALNRPHGFLDETQGTLFFNVAKIIEHHQPKAFLLENVKNLVNHDKGRTFEVIHRTLKELGYQVHWKVINSKSFVPQQRERIFIVGFREKNDFTFADLELPDALNGPKLGTILHPEDGTEAPDQHYTRGNIASVSSKYTLTDHLWRYLQNYAEKHKAAGNGFGFGLVGPDDVARTLSARYYKDGSEILVEQKGRNPRRLTPRECARLMGFDGPDESDFVIPVSDTQAYRQFGNSVVVPVVKAVADHMLPWIVGHDALGPERLQRKLALAG